MNAPVSSNLNDIDVISEVVKTYLLPLFERPSQTVTFDANENENELQPIENTVYGELKKSEKLSN